MDLLRRGLLTVGQANRKKKVSPAPLQRKSISPLHAAGFGCFWGLNFCTIAVAAIAQREIFVPVIDSCGFVFL
jgi:hypothetical protein